MLIPELFYHHKKKPCTLAVTLHYPSPGPLFCFVFFNYKTFKHKTNSKQNSKWVFKSNCYCSTLTNIHTMISSRIKSALELSIYFYFHTSIFSSFFFLLFLLLLIIIIINYYYFEANCGPCRSTMLTFTVLPYQLSLHH